MFWIIIAITIAIVLMIITDKGEAFLFVIPLLLLACLIASDNREITIEETTYHKILVVNGYYIDEKGNFITEDNIRSSVQSPAIPEKMITRPIYIKKHYTFAPKNFFKFKSENTSYELTFEYN